MTEREQMILNRLRQLWLVIQATNPANPLPLTENAFAVESALRTSSRNAALAEFQPLFTELMGGERVAAVNAGPINWNE